MVILKKQQKIVASKSWVPIAALLFVLLCTTTLPSFADQDSDSRAVENHNNGIAWRDLPADTRKALAPMANRWNSLNPQQQQRLLRRVKGRDFGKGAERWKNLSPEERERIRRARGRYQELPPEKRDELRQRWKNMSEDERNEAREARRSLRDYPPEQRHEMLEKLHKLPPQQRRAELEKLRHQGTDNKKIKKQDRDR